MSIETFQDILPLATRPSHYLGAEINSVKKDHGDVDLRVALAFPDLYEIGTSHFGIQILYHLLNQRPDIAAERVFAPGEDVEEMLRENNVPLCTIESKTSLAEFDIVGFSLLYELNYTNVLNMLQLSGIPFYSKDRDRSHPFIIAGGPCTCNPEPMSDFFDAMVIGDGERVVSEMADVWIRWKKEGKGERETLFLEWADIEGVYIPEFFEPWFDESGFQHVKPKFSHYNKVKRAVVPDLDRETFPCAPVMPHGKPVHDRLRLEVARGCTRGCRFCQAGMIYRPVRERSLDTMIRLSDSAIEKTGYDDVSLLSLSTGDYGELIPLLKRMMDESKESHIAVSLPSLRAGSLTPELMKLIKKVRKTGFTIAPEAGSQRLRDIINKNIDEEEIIDAVKNSFELGWRLIKLYFMIGLPMEKKEDLRAIVQLVKKLRGVAMGKRKPRGKAVINFSVAAFIPKPHVPFQWSPQISLQESRERITWLKHALRTPGVNFKWQAPEVSFLEGLWARGDRSLSELLVAAHGKGCKFDGWSDKFRFAAWQEAIEETGVNTEFYNSRVRDVNEPLPWDHIDLGVTKKFLESEWEKARSQELTEDCRQGECAGCGVCDFNTIAPRVHPAREEQRARRAPAQET
ncbi:MAG: TIGR03960 family B12-binding radical SAM protein, partial [Desulfobacterales bacterium]|nr:TIGR03960 family B12-binding radical SAM protein [Desulfobacterales bacterium]